VPPSHPIPSDGCGQPCAVPLRTTPPRDFTRGSRCEGSDGPARAEVAGGVHEIGTGRPPWDSYSVCDKSQVWSLIPQEGGSSPARFGSVTGIGRCGLGDARACMLSPSSAARRLPLAVGSTRLIATCFRGDSPLWTCGTGHCAWRACLVPLRTIRLSTAQGAGSSLFVDGRAESRAVRTNRPSAGPWDS